MNDRRLWKYYLGQNFVSASNNRLLWRLEANLLRTDQDVLKSKLLRMSWKTFRFWNFLKTDILEIGKKLNCPQPSKQADKLSTEKISRSALQRLKSRVVWKKVFENKFVRNVAKKYWWAMWTIYKLLSGLWNDHREKKLLGQKVQRSFTFIFSFWLYISCVPSYIGTLIRTWLTQNNDIIHYRSYVEIPSVY